MIRPPQQLGADIQASKQPQAVNLPGQSADRQQMALYGGGGAMQQVQRERNVQGLMGAREAGYNQAEASMRGANYASRERAGAMNRNLVQMDEEHQFASEQARFHVEQYSKQKEHEYRNALQALEKQRQQMYDNLGQIGEDRTFSTGQEALGGAIQSGAQIAAYGIENAPAYGSQGREAPNPTHSYGPVEQQYSTPAPKPTRNYSYTP